MQIFNGDILPPGIALRGKVLIRFQQTKRGRRAYYYGAASRWLPIKEDEALRWIAEGRAAQVFAEA